MNVNVLNKIPLAIASLVASSTAFAAMDTDSRVSRLEKEMDQVGVENAMGTYGANTAIGRPEVDGYGFYLTGDVLYWHAKVGGTEYAYTDQDPFAQFPVKGKTLDIEFDWDWGVRIGLGYNIDHDGWDTHLWYTFFETRDIDKRRANTPCNDIIVPLRGSVTITDGWADDLFFFAGNAQSKFELEYQDLVLELGRAYFVSRELYLRPTLGLKAAWIDLKQEVRYSGGTPDVDPYANGLGCQTVKVKDTSDFWGLGPRLGIDTKWHVTHGFSAFGNASASLIYGRFDVVHRERFTNPAFPLNHIRIDADRHAFSPNAQMQLGLMYETYFYNDRYHINIGLGYEVQYFWRQNQFLNINDVVVDQPAPKYDRFSEDISLHGVTLTIKWDF